MYCTFQVVFTSLILNAGNSCWVLSCVRSTRWYVIFTYKLGGEVSSSECKGSMHFSMHLINSSVIIHCVWCSVGWNCCNDSVKKPMRRREPEANLVNKEELSVTERFFWVLISRRRKLTNFTPKRWIPKIWNINKLNFVLCKSAN